MVTANGVPENVCKYMLHSQYARFYGNNVVILNDCINEVHEYLFRLDTYGSLFNYITVMCLAYQCRKHANDAHILHSFHQLNSYKLKLESLR